MNVFEVVWQQRLDLAAHHLFIAVALPVVLHAQLLCVGGVSALCTRHNSAIERIGRRREGGLLLVVVCRPPGATGKAGLVDVSQLRRWRWQGCWIVGKALLAVQLHSCVGRLRDESVAVDQGWLVLVFRSSCALGSGMEGGIDTGWTVSPGGLAGVDGRLVKRGGGSWSMYCSWWAEGGVSKWEFLRHPVAWAEPGTRGGTKAVIWAPVGVLVVLVVVELERLVLHLEEFGG